MNEVESRNALNENVSLNSCAKYAKSMKLSSGYFPLMLTKVGRVLC